MTENIEYVFNSYINQIFNIYIKTNQTFLL